LKRIDTLADLAQSPLSGTALRILLWLDAGNQRLTDLHSSATAKHRACRELQRLDLIDKVAGTRRWLLTERGRAVFRRVDELTAEPEPEPEPAPVEPEPVEAAPVEIPAPAPAVAAPEPEPAFPFLRRPKGQQAAAVDAWGGVSHAPESLARVIAIIEGREPTDADARALELAEKFAETIGV